MQLLDKTPNSYIGISTESRPTSGATVGSRWYNKDTFTWEIFDGTNWYSASIDVIQALVLQDFIQSNYVQNSLVTRVLKELREIRKQNDIAAGRFPAYEPIPEDQLAPDTVSNV